jgi:hypothetical protein
VSGAAWRTSSASGESVAFAAIFVVAQIAVTQAVEAQPRPSSTATRAIVFKAAPAGEWTVGVAKAAAELSHHSMLGAAGRRRSSVASACAARIAAALAAATTSSRPARITDGSRNSVPIRKVYALLPALPERAKGVPGSPHRLPG